MNKRQVRKGEFCPFLKFPCWQVSTPPEVSTWWWLNYLINQYRKQNTWQPVRGTVYCEESVLLLWRATGTDLLQSEDDGDVLLGAGGDQVVGQQLAGWQELVITALIDEDVELRPRVRRRQHRGVVRLKGVKTGEGGVFNIKRLLRPNFTAALIYSEGKRSLVADSAASWSFIVTPHLPSMFLSSDRSLHGSLT